MILHAIADAAIVIMLCWYSSSDYVMLKHVTYITYATVPFAILNIQGISHVSTVQCLCSLKPRKSAPDGRPTRLPQDAGPDLLRIPAAVG